VIVMRIFVAGASGVIGLRLVPLLVAAGHQVAGMTRTPAKAEPLTRLGAQPVVCDVFDPEALRQAVVAFKPDVIIDELTDLPDERGRIAELAAKNDRMRREGTRNLLAAAQAAGVSRIVVQSIAWKLSPERQVATDELERTALGADGVVLRYGRLYGPGTYFERELPPQPRIHVDEAARRTLSALDAPPGVLEVTETVPLSR